jgi:ADP-heptose:LPS heptosyltransferase
MWTRWNIALYTLYYRRRGRRLLRRGRTAALKQAAWPSPEAGEKPVLYVAWGRIGDAVMATGHLKHLRRVFRPHPVWLLGRPETEGVVRPHVDAFIPLKEDVWQGAPEDRDRLLQALHRPFLCIIADIHTFYGGVFVIGPLLERLHADRKFIYEGYHLGSNLAPWRPYPGGFEVVPQRPAPAAPDDISSRHVLHHAAHYFRTVLNRCRVPEEGIDDMRPELPEMPGAEDLSRKYGLEPGGFIAWQPASNNRKKDYPMARWAEVMAAWPDHLFVALGTRQEERKLRGFAAPNLRSLCGQTSLRETVQLIQAARLFVGLDSGLSHIATVLGQETVCVTQDSNLGYFFPYPPEYGFTNQHTVYHPDYIPCSGCFMTCRYESILSTYRRGALCLRTLPAEAVIAAIRQALSSRQP